MSFAPAIEFRSLAAQLTETETKIFITDFTASNPQLMTQALGALLINNAKHQNPTDTINVQCNKTISTIIQSRDSDDDDFQAVQLDSMPRRIIGHCACFLDQKSYGILSICNRAVYLGCNTPSKLTEVSFEYISHSDKLPVDLRRFPFATSLRIRDEQNRSVDDYFFDASDESIAFQRIIASQIAKMTRLQSLDLSEIDWSTKFLAIIANHQETIQRIKYLSVGSEFEDDNEQLIANIAAFKHLEFLKVKGEGSFEWNIKPLIEMCRNLKGLDFDDYGHGIEVSILQSIGHRLQYLTLNRSNTVKGIDFSDLRQIKQGTECDDNVMREVLRTARNLEKVKMNGDATLIQEILTKCKRLEYLEIDDKSENGIFPTRHSRALLQDLDAMECGLSQREKMQRNTFKIRISIRYAFIANSKECFVKLNRVIRSLSGSNLNHWMLVLYLQYYKAQTVCPLFNDLKQSLKNDIVNIERFLNSGAHLSRIH